MVAFINLLENVNYFIVTRRSVVVRGQVCGTGNGGGKKPQRHEGTSEGDGHVQYGNGFMTHICQT